MRQESKFSKGKIHAYLSQRTVSSQYLVIFLLFQRDILFLQPPVLYYNAIYTTFLKVELRLQEYWAFARSRQKEAKSALGAWLVQIVDPEITTYLLKKKSSQTTASCSITLDPITAVMGC